jgi:Zn-dependent protease
VINSTVPLIYSYLSIVNISLFAFNLVPLAFLDGSEVLDACLDMALRAGADVAAESYDPETISPNPVQWRRLWKDRLRHSVIASSSVMVFIVVVLALAREIA